MSRNRHGAHLLDRAGQDLVFSLRLIRRFPALTVAVLLTLGLGIAANATMFAIVDQVLLSAPHGLADPSRLALLARSTASPSGDKTILPGMAYPSYLEFRGMRDLFARATAASSPNRLSVGSGSAASIANCTFVADDYFGTLGVVPVAGRFFAPAETSPTDRADVAIISFGYWTSHFGRSPSALNQVITIGGTPFQIVGVTPKGFSGTSRLANDIWLPVNAASALLLHSDKWPASRGDRWLMVTVRVRQPLSFAAAQQRAGLRWTTWNMRPGQVVPSRPSLVAVSLAPGLNSTLPEHRVARLLAALSFVVLLIACANVSNLLLGRTISRKREIAIRRSFGVSPGRLVSLFVMDSIVLATCAAAVAFVITYFAVPVVRQVLFGASVTDYWAPNLRLVLAVVASALITALLTALLPIAEALSGGPGELLRAGMVGGTVKGSRVRFWLLVTQCTLAVVLVTGAGLFVRSLGRIAAQPVGFDLTRLLTVDVPASSDTTAGARRGLYELMRARAVAVPGVENATVSIGAPFLGQAAYRVSIPARDSIPDGKTPFMFGVDSNFFRTTGIRLVRGRALQSSDAGSRVAVVNASMAQEFWPSEDALGQCFQVAGLDSAGQCLRVIGVAEDTRRDQLLENPPSPQYFVPIDIVPGSDDDLLALMVRTNGRSHVDRAVQREVQSVRGDLPYVGVRHLTDLVAAETRSWHLGAELFSAFSGLALLVTFVGVLSVLRYNVSQRARELGIRRALGASIPELARQIGAEAGLAMVVAAVLGTLAALLLGRMLQALLFETSPHDLAVIVGANLIVGSMVVLGCVGPIWRACRIDPALSMRTD